VRSESFNTAALTYVDPFPTWWGRSLLNIDVNFTDIT